MKHYLLLFLCILLGNTYAQKAKFDHVTTPSVRLSPKERKAKELWKKGSEYMDSYKNHNQMKEENAAKALKYFSKAVKLNPKYIRAINDKGLALFYLKKYEQALAEFDKAIALDAKYSSAYCNKGLVYDKLKNYKEEEYWYRKTIELDSTDYVPYYNLADVYEDEYLNYEEAIKLYDKAIELKPGYLYAYHNRANAKMKNGMYHEALADLTYVIERDSIYKSAWNGRGLVKYYLKQYSEAILDLQQSLAVPTYFYNQETTKFTYNNLGNCYYALGNTEEACKYWKLGIANGYKYDPTWKKIWRVDDPVELVKMYCK